MRNTTRTPVMALQWRYNDDHYHYLKIIKIIILQRMSYYYNTYDDDAYECPVCYRIFDNGRNWRANENSMNMHLQVR